MNGKRWLPALLGASVLLCVSILSYGQVGNYLSRKGNKMILETVVVGQLGVNCFILGCPETKEGVVIDPGADPEAILKAINRLGLKISRIINTHGHFDHVGGNRRVAEATGAKIMIHQGDVPFLSRAATVASNYGLTTENSPPPDEFLTDGMTISFGTVQMKVLHTPGHTPGGCCLYLEKEGMVITGDTLFADSVGRTDFPGSSHEALISGIRTKLLPLPESTVVYPGHGGSSTIGHEKAHNPYL